ncbi:MAG: ABC transporter permease [Kordiimonadaceae bacterium]|nr:ABC transporter permease [Kordiimonadaceae bacterium]
MRARSAISIQQDVIFAIFLREMNARFKSYTFGNIWILVEPVLMMSIFVSLLSLRGIGSYGYSDPAVFILAGYVPFRLLWQATMKKNMSALGGAMGLLGFRQVRLFDVFLARTIVEGGVFLVTALLLVIGLYWLGIDAVPHNPLGTLRHLAELWLFAASFGILACVLAQIAQEIEQVITMLTMPLLFVSGVIFPMSAIPYKYHSIFAVNPLVHGIELIRENWLPMYVSPIADEKYLLVWIVITLALAVAGYRLRWQRMIAS